MRTSRWVPMITVAGVVAVLAGCGASSVSSAASAPSSTASRAPIVIGAAAAYSGLMTAYDQPPLQALELEMKQVNASGGILGRKLELVSSDTRSDPGQGKAAAESVLAKGASLVLVSCDYDYGSSAAIAAEQAGVLTFTLCAQATQFGPQGIGPLAYSPEVAAQTEGSVMAEWAHSKGWTRAFEMRNNNYAYTKDAADGFDWRWKQLGGAIVGTAILTDQPTIAAQISQLRSVSPQPQFIRLSDDMPDAASVVRQIRAAGISLPILGTQNMDGSYWLKATPRLSSFYYPAVASVFGDDPDPAINQYVKEFTKAYGSPPSSSYVLPGAAILQLYQAAVQRAGTTDSMAVAARLDKLTNSPTVIGPVTYTSTVHIALEKTMRIMRIQDGKNSYLATWKPQAVPPLGLS